jgi:Fe-S cluster biosynthesis and repair protein YggX
VWPQTAAARQTAPAHPATKPPTKIIAPFAAAPAGPTLDAPSGLRYPSGEMSARMVQCVKLGREAEGLEKPPLKGPIGEKVFNNVSKQAWQQWLEHSKMLINEYRLDLVSESGQKIWFTEMDKYFWGEGSKAPEQFKPVDADAPKADNADAPLRGDKKEG